MNFNKFLKNPKAYFEVAQKKAINAMRTVFYSGSNVYCEICKWKGKYFFNNKCPKCTSLPRTRLVPFSIKHFDLAKSNPRILHIAPNLNEYNFIRKNVTNLDKYDRLNIREVPHINIVQDLTQTNLESDHYDLVMAWHVLEHIPEDKKAISEVFRLLKPGGHFLISVPIYPKGNSNTYEDNTIAYRDYEKIHGHYDHCRSCGLDYYLRFEAVGFKTNTLEVKDLDKKQISYFGLKHDHVVWCFTKPIDAL